MESCVFCKIIKGEIPSFKVYEDEDFLGILDINPNTKGLTLLIPKKHLDSYIFDQTDDLISKISITSKKIAKKLENCLSVNRVGLIFEGMGVNHLHAKLYPMHGLSGDFEKMEHGTEKVFFNEYPGYLTTKIGEQADFVELEKLAQQILKS